MRDSNLLFFAMRAKSDYQKARRQLPLGITVCVFVACVTLALVIA